MAIFQQHNWKFETAGDDVIQHFTIETSRQLKKLLEETNEALLVIPEIRARMLHALFCRTCAEMLELPTVESHLVLEAGVKLYILTSLPITSSIHTTASADSVKALMQTLTCHECWVELAGIGTFIRMRLDPFSFSEEQTPQLYNYWAKRKNPHNPTEIAEVIHSHRLGLIFYVRQETILAFQWNEAKNLTGQPVGKPLEVAIDVNDRDFIPVFRLWLQEEIQLLQEDNLTTRLVELATKERRRIITQYRNQ